MIPLLFEVNFGKRTSNPKSTSVAAAITILAKIDG
jgi:hypothetical protein